MSNRKGDQHSHGLGSKHVCYHLITCHHCYKAETPNNRQRERTIRCHITALYRTYQQNKQQVRRPISLARACKWGKTRFARAKGLCSCFGRSAGTATHEACRSAGSRPGKRRITCCCYYPPGGECPYPLVQSFPRACPGSLGNGAVVTR